jgi:hypothetical protein
MLLCVPDPPKSRPKSVKTREGGKSTVQAALTLEEYRAAQQRAGAPKPAKPKPEEIVEETPAPPPLAQARALLSQRSSGQLVRSSGENLPKTKCSRCGKLAHEHPVGAVHGRSEACLKLVVFRDDDADLLDEIPDNWGPEDEYDDAGYYGEDDEAPSWLEAAGISRSEWDAQQQSQEEERERARTDRRLEAETVAMTEQWRSEVADKPRDSGKPGRRRI